MAMTEKRAEWRRRLVPALVVVTVASLLAFAVHIAGYDPPYADAKKDWLAVRAAWSADAYAPLLDLAEREGVELVINISPGRGADGIHPRTPGALLLMSPLALVPYRFVVPVWTGFNVVLLAWIASQAMRGAQLSAKAKIGFASSLVISAPVLEALRFVTLAPAVAVLTLLALRRVSSDAKVAGLVLGLGGTLKVFPFILLLPWSSDRRRVVAWAVGTAGVLNVLGLVLPGVDLRESWSALMRASGDYMLLPANASMLGASHAVTLATGMAAAGWAFGLGVTALTLRLMRDAWRNEWGWLILGLLVIPLSWISYDVVLIPAAVALAAERGEERRLARVSLLVYSLVGVGLFFEMPGQGLFGLAARLVLLGAIGASVGCRMSEGRTRLPNIRSASV